LVRASLMKRIMTMPISKRKLKTKTKTKRKRKKSSKTQLLYRSRQYTRLTLSNRFRA
jgi:hypothetical protein